MWSVRVPKPLCSRPRKQPVQRNSAQHCVDDFDSEAVRWAVCQQFVVPKPECQACNEKEERDHTRPVVTPPDEEGKQCPEAPDEHQQQPERPLRYVGWQGLEILRDCH